jgi:hypothetical protein
LSRLGDGVVFHDVWLAVRKPIRMPPARQNIVRS